MKGARKQLRVRRVSFGSIYKMMGIGLLFSVVPFLTLCGVCALFGARTLTWNGQNLFGITALVAGPLMGLFATALTTIIFGTLCAVGLWIFSLLRPMSLLVREEELPAHGSKP